jgi:dipeptidyl aminopeptidase/acylaminoacyl peptidase
MKRIRTALAVAALLAWAAAASAETYGIEQYLNIRRATGGSWSPDGKTIAFLSNESGVDQVWTIPAAGGLPKQITDFKERVDFVSFSPTEGRLVFGMDEGGNERTQLYLMNPDGSGLTKLTDRPDVIHTFGGWSHDGKKIAYAKNSRDSKYFDIYVLDMDTRRERLVFQADSFNEVMAWSWDDRFLVVSAWESNYNNDLYLVELETLHDKHLTPHNGWATYTNVVWPHKSKDFLLVSNLGQEWAKLGRFRIRRELLDYIDASLWNTEGLAVSRDGKRIAYGLNVNGYSKPVLIDLKKQKTFGTIPLTGGVMGHFRFSPDGEKVLFNFTSPTRPSDVWVFDVGAQSARQLTHSSTAGIPPETFIEPEFLKYPGHGGMVVPAYLYLPKDAAKDRAGAVLVYAHGGPEAQERPTFSGMFQYFLNQGVAVLAPNVRGSDGYGKSFIHLDDGRNRMDSLRDYAKAAEYLKTVGYFDERRVGLIGGSYGGWIVLAGLTEYPTLFAAGVSIVGIANFETFLEQTGPWRRALREAEYGSLEKDRDFLRSISPVHKADQIKAPLMLIQGANDPRVPAGEAEQMAEAVRANGGTVEYLLYADEGHGLTKLTNRLDAYPKMAAFLKRYLIDTKVAEPEAEKD